MNIVITGAGKGLGLALVKKFAEIPGNKIIAISRNIENLYQLTDYHLNGKLNLSKIIPYSFDLVQDDFKELFEFITLETRSIDILINNAGHLVKAAFLEISEMEFDASFDTNVKAVFRSIQSLYPLLNKGSHIVNIASMAGFQGSVKFPGLSVYSASKAALIGLTQSLAAELSDEGIAVNALALVSVQTEMLTQAFPAYKAPLSATQMADFVADFAINGLKYFNGQVLPVALSTP